MALPHPGSRVGCSGRSGPSSSDRPLRLRVGTAAFESGSLLDASAQGGLVSRGGGESARGIHRARRPSRCENDRTDVDRYLRLVE